MTLIASWRKVFETNEYGKIDRIIWYDQESVIISGQGRRARSLRYADGLEVWQLAATTTNTNSNQDTVAKHCQVIKNRYDPGTIHILSDDLLWSVSSYGEMLWSIEIPIKSTLKNLFLLSTSQYVIVGSLDSNSNQLQVTYYSKQNGQQAFSSSLPWSFNAKDSLNKCSTMNNLILCSNNEELSIITIPTTTDDTNVKTRHIKASSKIEQIRILYESTTRSVILIKSDNGETKIYQFNKKESTSEWDFNELNIQMKSNSFISIATDKNLAGQQILEASANDQKLNFHVSTINEQTLTNTRSYSVELPENMGEIEYLAYSVVKNTQLVTLRMQDGSLLVIKLADNGAELILHRDEALSSIISVETFDLSLSITQMRIEEEFGGTGMFSMFTKRISSQVSQLISFFLRLMDLFTHGNRNRDYLDKQAALVRDEFNLNKILIVVTSVGKVFGILTQSGGILWKNFFPNFAPFEHFNAVHVPLFHIRSAAHYTHEPLASIVYRDRNSLHDTHIRTFNPYTGDLENNLTTSSLPYHVKRVFLSTQAVDEFCKVLLFVDTNNKIHTYPSVPLSRALSTTIPTYIYLFDKSEQAFVGYYLSIDENDQKTSTNLKEVWRVSFQNEEVINIHTRLSSDRVHSAGIVLGDRSVLYKYTNPNLIAVVTEGIDYQKVPFVNIYLLDTVTGSVKLSHTHKRVKSPVHIVLSENWIVYTYYNQRYRRYEAVSSSLFEGEAQYNYSTFSSFDPIEPVIQSKAYILPYGVNAIQVTTTEKGITSRDIIMATPNGMLIEIPWILFDPRRPLDLTPMDREEGLIMYTPEIMVNFESVINYYKYVYNIRGIHTVATGLESTSIVFAYGLDLFFTRVFPSRIFDQLKDDFDFMFIGWSTVAFVVGSFVAKRFASIHQTKKAWK
ncbi:unnamed protein product [Adineta steineri]|uniref:ER membrane protein complex subunit 1 n=1 Tax=Adineta steineri TaxID=433720 RepID=A0A818NI83_9BILA|nr:unnamed protein product [Adineta steineri]CAF0847316.1 unnamed protein product [Adineta steineri]CAF3551795.1 unnamed protein product [Adineta steineri]CAF3605368.1 unnamed protein product [Adineta steineri]